MQGVNFNISEGKNDNTITMDSFYKPNNTQYSDISGRGRVSVKSIKENISEPVNNYDFGRDTQSKRQDHQIEFSSGSHPNEALVPKRGVTLRTGAGVGQKGFPQNSSSLAQNSNGIGNKRMSRAQYAATIAVSFPYKLPY